MEMTDNEKMLSIITQFNEMIKMVGSSKLSIDDALLKSQNIFNSALKTFYKYPSWWTSYKDQIKRTSRFLEEFGGDEGFTPDDIPPPPTNFEPLTMYEVPLLVVNFPDRNGIGTTQRTFDAYRDSIRFDRYDNESSLDRYRDDIKSDPANLRLVPGIDNTPGIYWVAFDPDANKGQSPGQYWTCASDIASLAHVHVLAAVMLFENWPMMWDKKISLFPNLPGYQLYFRRDWYDTLGLFRDYRDYILLNGYRAKQADNRWSVPTVRRL